MNNSINPFERGYQGFRIERLALIHTTDLTDQWCRLPIHSSQTEFDDSVFKDKKVIFSDQYALIEINSIPEPLRSECQYRGHVIAVSYRVIASYGTGETTVVNDASTILDAQRMIEDFQRENSTYERCWEISSQHLPEDVIDDLIENAILEPPMSFAPLLIDLFVLPDYYGGGPAGLGVRISNTPWTDQHLLKATSIDTQMLRNRYVAHEVPQSFIDVVFQAAQANVRILIFDTYAKVLKGLPTYENE